MIKNYLKTINKNFYLKENIRSLFEKSNQNRTIYHCCIQKSASQWFAYFWNDDSIRQHTNLSYFNPDEDFCVRNRVTQRKLRWIPKNRIVSPLFVRYPDYQMIPKPKHHKTYFVARDPRDVIVSSYFSVRYSHPPNPQVNKIRKELNSLSKDDGIMFYIKISQWGYFLLLDEWIEAYEADGFAWFKYEDLFGPHQTDHFKRLMDHLEINISKDELNLVLQRNSFENVAGHNRGKEDIHHHYRKGISNDWMEHFKEEHKTVFKELSGDLLIRLGYENDNNW